MTNEERNALFAARDAEARVRAEKVTAALGRSPGAAALRPRQRAVVEQCLRGLLSLTSMTTGEFKRLEVSPWGAKGAVQVVAEVGMAGDEGTAAEALCRERAQFWVTARGSVSTVSGRGRVLHGGAAAKYVTTYGSVRDRKRSKAKKEE